MKRFAFLAATALSTLYVFGCAGTTDEGGVIGTGTNADNSNSPPAVPAPVIRDTQPDNASDTPIDFDEADSERDYFYFSYDDSASTAGMELVKYSLENNSLPPISFVRPHEFLNFETFDREDLEAGGLFYAGISGWERQPLANDESSKPIFELGAHIATELQTTESQKNIVLTLLVDVSGSMGSEAAAGFAESSSITLLDLVKNGLNAMADSSLKIGDTINLITFSSTSDDNDVLLEGWTYDGENIEQLKQQIANLALDSATNLDAGINNAYRVANDQFDSGKSNRVIILTDAHANRGELDASIIGEKTEINDLEGIYFSGIGVGFDFDETFLNVLTEEGKGTYMSMVTPADANRLFTDRFIALTQVAARNVEFRLEYPKQLIHIESAAEELSENRDDVKSINFSMNSSQYFLESFEVDEELEGNEEIRLSIAYTDNNGEAQVESFEYSIDELITPQTNNIQDAFIIRSFAKIVNGTMTCEEFFAIRDAYLEGYDSRIWQEYLPLIETYYRLAQPAGLD